MKSCKLCKFSWNKPGSHIDWHCRKSTIAKAVRIGELGSDADLKAHNCKFWERLV